MTLSAVAGLDAGSKSHQAESKRESRQRVKLYVAASASSKFSSDHCSPVTAVKLLPASIVVQQQRTRY